MAQKLVEIRPTIGQLQGIILSQNGSNKMGGGQANIPLVCPICGKSFRNRGCWRFHLKKSHNQQVDSVDMLLGVGPNFVADKVRFFCPFPNCKAVRSRSGYFNSAKLLIQHFQKAHHEKKYKCTDCSAKFALERDLRYHMKKVCPNRVKIENMVECNAASNSDTKRMKQSVGIQTEWLVPTKVLFIGNYRKICSKKLKPITHKDISTQTYSQTGDSDVLNVGTYYSYCTRAHQMEPMVERTMLDENSNFQQQQQYQHSYAQTIYPQTNDFGAQHPAIGVPAAANYGGGGGQIYLNPLQVASTQTQQQISTILSGGPPLFDNNNGLLAASIQHCETQTPPIQLVINGNDGSFPCPPWANMDIATVAAQTDLTLENLDTDWFADEGRK